MSEWDRLAGEPVLWYSRFDIFRLLGPGRNLDQAYRVAGNKEGRAGTVWWRASRTWDWERRAEAWDVGEREKLRAEEEERRRLARQRRLELLGAARESAWAGILVADLAELDVEAARGMLGSLRLLLMDALKGERLELGEPTEIVAEAQAVEFHADELARAQDELREWREKRKELSG